MKKNKLDLIQSSSGSGFTLIELLIVIAIIGLITSLSIFLANSARVKARDAKKLSDVRQMVSILALENASSNGLTPAILEGCVVAGANVNTCTGPGEIDQWSTLFYTNQEYTIRNTGATVANAEITFTIESGAGGLDAGDYYINSSGVITLIP